MNLKQVHNMSNDELRIKVAELCGECGIREDGKPYDLGLDATTELAMSKLPDFIYDLNTMHEAENDFLTTPQLRIQYRDNLFECGVFALWNATARQKAEAFVLTMETE
jgi:hypothetical protein